MDDMGELLLVRTAVVTVWRWNTSLHRFLRWRLRRGTSEQFGLVLRNAGRQSPLVALVKSWTTGPPVARSSL